MVIPLLEQVVAGRAPGIERLTVTQFHRMIELGILKDLRELKRCGASRPVCPRVTGQLAPLPLLSVEAIS